MAVVTYSPSSLEEKFRKVRFYIDTGQTRILIREKAMIPRRANGEINNSFSTGGNWCFSSKVIFQREKEGEGRGGRCARFGYQYPNAHFPWSICSSTVHILAQKALRTLRESSPTRCLKNNRQPWKNPDAIFSVYKPRKLFRGRSRIVYWYLFILSCLISPFVPFDEDLMRDSTKQSFFARIRAKDFSRVTKWIFQRNRRDRRLYGTHKFVPTN